MLALLVIVTWVVGGPFFGYSDTSQLVVNTGTTVMTFLMVFLLQNTQNRDSAALHPKLDDLIRVTEGAHNALLDLEELEGSELKLIRDRYEDLARHARERPRGGELDTRRVEVDLSPHP